MARRALSGLLFAALALASVDAHGDEPGDAVRLEYTAPDTCPTRDDFTARVRARVPALREPATGETPRVFQATLATDNARATGTLTIVEPGGTESTRRVDAPDCGELADALAFIIALAIDPRAGLAPAVEDRAPPPTLPPPSSPAPESPRRNRNAEPRWRAESAVHALLVAGLAPGSLPGVRFGLGVTSANRGWASPSTRLSLELTTRRSFGAPFGTVSFAWAAGSLELCPLQAPLGPRVSLRPCVLGELGTVEASGSTPFDPRSVSALWGGAGALLGLGAQPARWLRFEARGAAVVPAARDRFVMAGEVVHEHAPVTWRGEMGLSAQFP